MPNGLSDSPQIKLYFQVLKATVTFWNMGSGRYL